MVSSHFTRSRRPSCIWHTRCFGRWPVGGLASTQKLEKMEIEMKKFLGVAAVIATLGLASACTDDYTMLEDDALESTPPAVIVEPPPPPPVIVETPGAPGAPGAPGPTGATGATGGTGTTP